MSYIRTAFHKFFVVAEKELRLHNVHYNTICNTWHLTKDRMTSTCRKVIKADFLGNIPHYTRVLISYEIS